eukprot:3649924-Prymnesium_polylepis.1
MAGSSRAILQRLRSHRPWRRQWRSSAAGSTSIYVDMSGCAAAYSARGGRWDSRGVWGDSDRTASHTAPAAGTANSAM